MAGRVTVQGQLFERQGIKVVLSADEQVREVPAGELPDPAETLLGRMGEPSFGIRLDRELKADADVPDEVGLAVRRAGRRLLEVRPHGVDATDATDTEGWAEAVVGPVVEDGVLVVRIDTDDKEADRLVIDAMAAIFVEELEPLEVEAEVMAGPGVSEWLRGSWLSSRERAAAALRP